MTDPIKAGWTTHGHAIPGVPQYPLDRPTNIARCGGPGLCNACAVEAAGYVRASTPDTPPANPIGAALMSMGDLFSGFVDLATGTRKQLIEAGFSESAADDIASEFLVQSIRMAFSSIGKKQERPPSFLDLLRRPKE